MKDILIVITGYYPYGNGEEFFETEIEYLSKGFDRIYIIPSGRDFRIIRPHPENVVINSPKKTGIDRIFSPKYIFNENLKKNCQSSKMNIN